MDIGVETIIKDLVKDLSSSVLKKTIEIGKKEYQKTLVILELCFSKYLKRSYERYSKIKTLLYRDRPVDLKAHYVPTDFLLGEEQVNGSNIFESFQENRKNIVVGTAGSGKSVLLRRIFIDLIENKKGYVPILIELRLMITPDKDYSIFSFIHKTLSDLDEAFTEEQLHFSLKEGKIALFLDGFDEIDFNKKETYEREILEISNTYSNSIIVISSRPDECFSSWDEFHIYHAQPLNKEQSVDLISRIEYDKTVKNKFIKELESGLYEKHDDFLSNPLLLTMMLLTYEQLAEIPEKVHIFYEQAFDTLYHKHDALKSLYKRKSYTSLPIDDFKKIFSTFCMITFSERKMSFSHQEIIVFLKQSIEIEDFNVNENDFFNDLIKSVCIIQKDGNIYTFSHRSFQEYFAAYFISKSQSIDTTKVLDNIVKSYFRDSIINMLFELNREKLETEWVIPKLNEIIEKTTPLINEKDTLGFIALFYDAFMIIDPGIGLRFSENLPNGPFTSCLQKLYSKEFKTYFFNDDNDEESQLAINENDRKLFFENTNSNESSRDILISDMPENIEWLSQTWIPEYCIKKQKFMVLVCNQLTNKYKEKEKNLASILFG